jgi:nicotinamidase-related amidase
MLRWFVNAICSGVHMTLAFEPRRTALVLIDPQNWTLELGIAPHVTATVVNNASALGRALQGAGFVIWTRAAFSNGYADMLQVPVDMALRVPESGLSDEALAFNPLLEPTPDLVITKRQWSAFYGTELDLQLRRRRIETVIIAGAMTNFGVESTARDAWQRNYAVVIAEDACSSINLEMHEFAIASTLPRIARVRSTREIIEALSTSSAAPALFTPSPAPRRRSEPAARP